MRSLPRLSRAGLAVLAVAVSTSLLPAAAGADGKARDTCSKEPSGVALGGGATTLTLDRAVAGVLAENGVAVAPVAPASANADGSIAFPITGGTLGDGSARIDHSGGLTFSGGGASLTATDFSVRVDGARGVLVAQVGGAAVPLLKLDLRDAAVGRAGAATTITGVQAALTKEAAAALNATFSVSLFTKGLKIGTVAVKALPAEIAVTGGATSLALDPGAAAALQSLGVAASPIGPATAGDDGALQFPITGGTLQPAALTGSISHSGGILLAKGSTKVALRKFEIVLDDTPTLSAKVGGDRVEILSLDLAGLTVTEGEDGTLVLGGVVGRLTAAAAGALNAAFGTDAFAEGLVLGTATVRAQLG
jgi:hypothetical protein